MVSETIMSLVINKNITTMIHFEDENISKDIKKTVEGLIDSGSDISGNVRVDFIPEEDLACYDGYESFIKEHKGADFYMVSEIVVGNWSQPLTMAAEEY